MIPALILTAIHFLLSPPFWKALFTDGKGSEWRTYNGVLDGSIGIPWNRRILAHWILKWIYKLTQNFMLATFIYKFLLLWGVIALYNLYSGANTQYLYLAIIVAGVWSGQRFNTYLDLILMLGVFVLQKLSWNLWPIPLPIIACLGAMNRETWGLIFPILCLQLIGWYGSPVFAGYVVMIIFSVVVFVVTYMLMRIRCPQQHLTCPQHTPGWGLVLANIENPLTWILCGLAYWPIVISIMNGFFDWHGGWIFLPSLVICVMGNFWAGNMRESGLLLNPYLLLLPYM